MVMLLPSAPATVTVSADADAITMSPATLPPPLQPSDFGDFNPTQAALGRLLFYDPILSGNRNIACGTCHNHAHAGGDGLSLGIGEGGDGIGENRNAGSGESRIKKRIPRNAPALWNVGAKEVKVLLHDGRVSESDRYDNGFDTPAEEWLPRGLNGVLAAQSLLPMASQFEMAGNPKENEIAGAIHDRVDSAWRIIAKRVRGNREYARQFIAAFADLTAAADITIVHIGNALAAFQASEWQSYDSAFDAFLRGDKSALTGAQKRGAELFYGDAGCAECHAGALLTDHQFHAIALPQFGPGRVRRWEPVARDVGRMGVTDRIKDAYRFRTPSLRNVALTAPYGHNGAYPTLRGIIRHHLNPSRGLATWDKNLARLPQASWLAAGDFLPLIDKHERARLRTKIDITPRNLTDAQIDQLIAFMHSLTGNESISGRLGAPKSVPSGLPVAGVVE